MILFWKCELNAITSIMVTINSTTPRLEWPYNLANKLGHFWESKDPLQELYWTRVKTETSLSKQDIRSFCPQFTRIMNHKTGIQELHKLSWMKKSLALRHIKVTYHKVVLAKSQGSWQQWFSTSDAHQCYPTSFSKLNTPGLSPWDSDSADL